MKVSEALTGAVEDFLEVMPDITSHMEKTDNPHEVTKKQVGLENVLNERQITENDLSDHADGTIYRHPAEAIDYSENFNLKEKIEDLIITGGGGTLYHDELLNRDSGDAHPMSSISGLVSAMWDIDEDLEGLDKRCDEVIVFEGTTANATPTELETTDTSDYIDEDGNFTVPEGRAVYVELCGFSVQASGGEITSATGTCFIKSNAFFARSENQLMSTISESSIICLGEETDETDAHFGIEDATSLHITAEGLADTTLSWHVEVRIKNVFDITQ